MKEIQKKRKEGDCVNDIMNDISNEYMNHLVTKYHINGVKLWLICVTDVFVCE